MKTKAIDKHIPGFVSGTFIGASISTTLWVVLAIGVISAGLLHVLQNRKKAA